MNLMLVYSLVGKYLQVLMTSVPKMTDQMKDWNCEDRHSQVNCLQETRNKVLRTLDQMNLKLDHFEEGKYLQETTTRVLTTSDEKKLELNSSDHCCQEELNAEKRIEDQRKLDQMM
jgi:hypothetical protein